MHPQTPTPLPWLCAGRGLFLHWAGLLAPGEEDWEAGVVLGGEGGWWRVEKGPWSGAARVREEMQGQDWDGGRHGGSRRKQEGKGGGRSQPVGSTYRAPYSPGTARN